MTPPALVTFPAEVRAIAQSRGVRLTDVERIACTGCGVSGAADDVMALGLGHFDGCDAEAASIKFRRARPATGGR